MKPYGNRKASGISAYEIGDEYIKVRFLRTARPYTYSYQKAGKQHVEKMKKIAQKGLGLNNYINKFVKDLND